MTIEWFGATCIRLTTSESTAVIDPFSATTGLKLPRLNADLLLLSHGGTDPKAVGGTPFLIDSPGEYEVKRTFVYGISVAASNGAPLTLYRIEAEGVTLAHLGNLGHQLTNGELEQFEGVDVLMLPVGGHGVLDADAASDVISAVEPRVVIPMNYKLPGLKQTLDPVTAFAKELGVKESETISKYKFSAKDLPQEKMDVIILTP